MSKKMPGRPTDAVKNSILKIRIDSDTIETLDSIAETTKQNRSELVRDILPHISSHDFEKMISLATLQRLETYSIQCDNYFKTQDFKVDLEEVSIKYPAFVVESSPIPILYIKFPTYKLRLLSEDKYEEIQSLISGINGISVLYQTPCLLIHSSETKNTFLPEVMCLKKSLSENIELKDTLSNLFTKYNLKHEIWPAYSIVGHNVKIITENGKKFVISSSL